MSVPGYFLKQYCAGFNSGLSSGSVNGFVAGGGVRGSN